MIHSPEQQAPNTTATDLASAVNAVKDFSGSEHNDVFTWERQVLKTIRIFSLDEKAQLKL
ncbi:hypothetical protein COBT_003013, partial [Conglomerata obtusa]